MKGRIKMALVSIKYKHKESKLKAFKLVRTKKVNVLIVIDEENKILKFKKRTINNVCNELNLKIEKLTDVDIDSIEILKDLGSTNYEI